MDENADEQKGVRTEEDQYVVGSINKAFGKEMVAWTSVVFFDRNDGQHNGIVVRVGKGNRALHALACVQRAHKN